MIVQLRRENAPQRTRQRSGLREFVARLINALYGLVSCCEIQRPAARNSVELIVGTSLNAQMLSRIRFARRECCKIKSINVD